jgi:translation initiation factor IF-2
VEEKSGQTTATVLVKRGKLKLNDIFVSGLFDGRIKFMKDDNGRMVSEALPG